MQSADNPFSSVAKEFRDSTDLSQIQISVKSLDPSLNRELYLSSKQCIICGITLGRQSEEKKHCCHFCYNAVCGNCSLLTIHHPESNKEERACNQCYLRFLNDKVLDISEEFVKIKLKEEIAEKEREIQRRKQIVQEINDNKEMIAEEKRKAEAKIKQTEEDIKEKERLAKEQEEKNRNMKLFIEELIRQNKIDPEEYKKIEPDFVPSRKSNDCIKCLTF